MKSWTWQTFTSLALSLFFVEMCSAQSHFTVVERTPVRGAAAVTARPAGGSNGIQYNGGPVIDSAHGANVYFIWYGDWSGDHARDTQQIVTDFLNHLGGSPYWNVL